jgi:hypothetical protein
MLAETARVDASIFVGPTLVERLIQRRRSRQWERVRFQTVHAILGTNVENAERSWMYHLELENRFGAPEEFGWESSSGYLDACSKIVAVHGIGQQLNPRRST